MNTYRVTFSSAPSVLCDGLLLHFLFVVLSRIFDDDLILVFWIIRNNLCFCLVSQIAWYTLFFGLFWFGLFLL